MSSSHHVAPAGLPVGCTSLFSGPCAQTWPLLVINVFFCCGSLDKLRAILADRSIKPQKCCVERSLLLVSRIGMYAVIPAPAPFRLDTTCCLTASSLACALQPFYYTVNLGHDWVLGVCTDPGHPGVVLPQPSVPTACGQVMDAPLCASGRDHHAGIRTAGSAAAHGQLGLPAHVCNNAAHCLALSV